MLAQRGDEGRMSRLDLLERHATPFVHEVDQAEVAGSHDDDLPTGHVVLGLPLGRVRARCLAHGEPDHRVLLVAARDSRHVAGCERAGDEILE